MAVNVDVQALNAMTQPAGHPTSCLNNQAPNIMTQQQKRCRCAMRKNGFLDPRCFAPLRTASLGMTMMRHPSRERVAAMKSRGGRSTHGAREAVCSGVVTPGGNSRIRMFLK